MKPHLDKYFKRPLFFQTQSKLYFQGSSVDLYLDFDAHDKLKDFGIVSDVQSESLLSLAEKLSNWIGKSPLQMQDQIGDGKFDFLSYLIWNSVDQYVHLSEKKATSYLCHCLGVSEKDISDFVHQYPDKNWPELVRSLKVGTHCGDCKTRIKDFIYDIHKTDKHKFVSTRISKTGKRFYPLGLTPAQFILKLDQTLKNVFGNHIMAGIVKVNGQKVELQIKGDISADEVSKKLREVEGQLGILLIFHFSLD